MAASYPGAVKTFSAVVNGTTKLVAALFNTPNDEITAIETELGTDVAGSVSDLKTRLAVSLDDDGTFKLIKNGAFTGNGVQGTAVAHGLGAKPSTVFWFPAGSSGGSGDWGMWIEGMSTNCTNGGAVIHAITTEPDATNFYLPASGDGNNNGITYKFIALKAN